MGDITYNGFVAELQRRISGISSANAGAAVNRAIRNINGRGAYTFQLVDKTTVSVATTGLGTTPSNLDAGKPIYVEHTATGTPVRRKSVTDLWLGNNYNTNTNSGFEGYLLIVASAPPHQIRVFPAPTGAPESFSLVYHKISADISGTTVANLPRDFDDLVVDLAEASEKRIYDVGTDWPTLMQAAEARLSALLDAYRSETIIQGLSSEAQESIAEKTKVGNP